jgi:hypothetical protein
MNEFPYSGDAYWINTALNVGPTLYFHQCFVFGEECNGANTPCLRGQRVAEFLHGDHIQVLQGHINYCCQVNEKNFIIS